MSNLNYVPVSREECIIHKNKPHPSGYVQLSRYSKGKNYNVYAHRFAYQEAFGAVPDGMSVCHKCDVKNCVNPEHLFLGSHVDNMQDRTNKGRGNSPVGETHGRSKLVTEEVLAIRRLYAQGQLTYKKLGEMFGVDLSQISNIINRKLWKHI